MEMGYTINPFLYFISGIRCSYGQKKEQEISGKWLDCNV